MKKLPVLLLVFCLQLVTTKAQFVTIPDANFVTKLTQKYPGCMSGNMMDTTCSQIINEDTLFVTSLGIADLTGIEYFDNLIFLDCYANQLSNLPQLPNSLITLGCMYNQLTSLPILSTSLEVIYCGYNQLTNLPQLPNSLTGLHCNNNQLTSLPALPVSLVLLQCQNNQLTNLPSLPNSLGWLMCGSNQLTNIPLLPNNLAELECSSNLITSLPTLPTYLQILKCDNNQLANLPSLPSSLTQLKCAHNQLTSISSLPNNLGIFDCSYNQITSLPLLPANLGQFACSKNQLTSMPHLPNTMYWLLIDSNNISCVTNLPQINNGNNPLIANISNNPLTCVPNQTNYSLGLPLCLDNDPVNNPLNCISLANITGYVYKDMNTNCTYENTDLRSENIPVKLYDNQNNFLAFSSTVNGVYSFTGLQPDTFKVKINDSTLLVSMACGQANNQSAILDSVNQTISNINFPVVCDTEYDLYVQSVNAQGMVFPGQTHALNTNITNNVIWYNLNCATTNYTGTVTIQVTGLVTYISPASGALMPIVNGNTFTYNISNFNNLNPASFGLRFMTDTTALAGSPICVHVEINPTPLDGDTSNNVYDFCYNVVNSYDPNMKEVYPVNVLPGYDDWFTYTIHFQNTGNAPAFNIRLRDTLDANLDANTFEILGYSHAANTTISGNILTVRFNNIMLPDSTTDYEGSMGYFQYRLKPLPNLPNGTQIENTAYIYFDYNAPIITNTTQNNFDITVGKHKEITSKNEFLLYPNPSNGVFSFKDTKNVKQVEVYNLLGEQILSQSNHKQINLSGFAKGIYYAKINGDVVIKLVKE